MTVHFFGKLGDMIGREVEVEAPAGCTVAELRALLARLHPHAGEELASPSLRAAIGDALVAEDCAVPAGGAVEFFPPLSGG